METSLHNHNTISNPGSYVVRVDYYVELQLVRAHSIIVLKVNNERYIAFIHSATSIRKRCDRFRFSLPPFSCISPKNVYNVNECSTHNRQQVHRYNINTT